MAAKVRGNSVAEIGPRGSREKVRGYGRLSRVRRVGSCVYNTERGLNVVLVVYSDESGTGSIQSEPITVVAGLMLNMTEQWPKLERRMLDAERLFPDLMSGPPREREFKGRQLFKRMRRPEGHEATNALMHLLSIVQHVKCPIFHGAVDRAVHRASQNRPRTPRELRARTALDWAFHDCMKAVQSFISTVLPGQDVLWIHDHAGAHEAALRMAHEMFSESTLRDVRVGWFDRDLRLDRAFPNAILDTIYFGHSHLSRVLQLADVCASVIRAMLEKQPDAELFYSLIEPYVVKHGSAPRFAKSR